MDSKEKNTLIPPEGSSVPDEGELELINSYTVEPLNAQEVFCFTLTLCDNEIDRDFERFSIESLKALEAMFIGKTGIEDHSMKTGHQHSRIFKTWLEVSENEKTSTGEHYTALKAKAYIPVSEKSAQLISEIKSGIKKETSISCSVDSLVCSICSAEQKTGGCKHRKGEVYNGRICHTVLEKPKDAYEFSFVAVPAQPKAGVTKAIHTDISRVVKQSFERDSITLSKSAFAKLNDEIRRLEELKADGERYRAELVSKVARLGAMAVEELDRQVFEDLCTTLPTEKLLMLEKAFSANAAKQFPLTPQLVTFTKEDFKDNNEFKI